MKKFELKDFVQECLCNYGAEQEKDYILRFFADHEKKGGAFCAIIRSEEAQTGVYTDLSLVLFANYCCPLNFKTIQFSYLQCPSIGVADFFLEK